MPKESPNSSIAVIGLSCWYPGADSPRQLWENVLARRRQFRQIPECRLPLAHYYHPDPGYPDTTYAQRAAVIDGFDFDWQHRRIPRSTFQSTDTSHWLALEVALSAIADAGYTRDKIPSRTTGVIVGNTLTGEQTRSNTMRLRWPYIRRAFQAAARSEGLPESVLADVEVRLESYYKSVFPPVNEDSLAGGLSNTIAGRICNYLDLYGGGYTVDGACSSSLLAVVTAASALLNGDLDLALAGGVDISLDPFELVGFSKTGALAREEMRVYDRRGDGFIPGEGCGFVILKRLEDARRDSNYIYAVLKGWGVSSDGGGSAITAPNAEGQSLALRRAYDRAPYEMEDLQFIEGHGTGTTAGDRAELEALSLAMGRTERISEGFERVCGMTSLKSIIGHTKAAAGAGGFIKAVLAVNRRILPPTAGLQEPHHVFESNHGCFFPILYGECRQPTETLRAGISAMGFGGINCHVTIESGDPPSPRLEPAIEERNLMVSNQETEVFVLTAESPVALRQQIGDLSASVRGLSFAELTDLAAELGKAANPQAAIRSAVIAERPEGLLKCLNQLLTMVEQEPPSKGEMRYTPDQRIWLGNRVDRSRVAMLFPGQGSQKLNMARVLVERFPWARELVEKADRLIDNAHCGPISHLIYRPLDRAKDSEAVETWFKALSQTEIAQPAICLASVLWYRFLRKMGIIPVAAGGHSLGELTAFHVAGAFDFSTLLRLAAMRGRAMAAPGEKTGGMVSLQCTQDQAEAILDRVNGYVVMANINEPRQIVLSGEEPGIEEVIRIAAGKGVRSRRLAVSNAFHSRLMDQAARRLEKEAPIPKTLDVIDIPLFSSVNGQAVERGLSLRQHFADQVLAQVNFLDMIRSMAADCDVFVEVGPGRVLSGLVNRITEDGGPNCIPVESRPFRDVDLNTLLARLFIQGVDVNWEALYDGRLIRPFKSPSERLFIENPCERPFDHDETGADHSDQVQKNILDHLSAGLDGLTEEELKAYFKARGPFISQVIQADLKYSEPRGLQINGESGPSKGLEARDLEKKDGRVDRTSAPSGSRKEREILLLSLVEEITGFSQDSLNLEMRILDDLNLDSIKAGDLLAKAMKRTGFEGEFEPLDYANATLREVLDQLTDLGSTSVPDRSERKAVDPLAVLREQAALIMGLSNEALDPDALLERDLGMGLDALRELLRRSSPLLNIEPNVDPLPLLKRSLKQIAVILERISPEQVQAPPLSNKLELDLWVREFAVELVQKALPDPPEWWGNRQEDDWHSANILILKGPDDAEVCEALQRQFIQHGAQVHAASFEEARNQALATDISYTHLMAILPRKPGTYEANEAYLQAVVEYLASLTPSPSASRAPRRRTTVGYIQFGGGYFGSRPQVTDLNPCCATALGKSLHLERSDLRVRVLDFFPFLDPEKIAVKVIEEMNTSESFSAVGFDRKQTRRVSRQRLLQPASYRPRSSTWSGEDVILVTGGARGITAFCAFAVAKTTGARVALVGLSPHPPKQPEDRAGREIASNLEKYADNGLVARYFSCDVTDIEAVASLIRLVREEMGPVTGVIHGAGLNHPRPANLVSVKDALHEVSPKVMGALNLLYLLEDTPPKIFIGLSSIIGVTGMPGNAWYGFSNESLDVILRRFESDHPETQVLTVSYSIWRDEGMGARMGSVTRLRRMGVHAIPTEEGVRRFVRLFLNDPGVRQVIVSARLGGLDTWQLEPVPTALKARYLEYPLLVTMGVESVFQARLTLEKDPYLKDHAFNGSYLFPTVFGLEAMAQVVAHATGKRDFNRVRIEKIKLERPITVDPEEGDEIVVWAQVMEQDSESDLLVVRTGITKPHAGVKTDFFSATFILGLTDEPPEYAIDLPDKPLDICPETDLYRENLLFQGPRFQRIQKIWALDAQDDGTAKEAIFSARLSPPTEGEDKVFPDHSRSPLFLGDPFCRDTLLQSAQLLVPREACLPVGIDHLDIYPSGKNAPTSVLVYARLDEIKGQEIKSTVVMVDEEGCVRGKLEGYKLSILKRQEENPSTSDLLSPDIRDNRIIERTLQDLSDTLNVQTPKAFLTYIPGIHNLSKEARHDREIPVVKEAVHQALESHHAGHLDLDIQWSESGKPIIIGPPENHMGISLSHDDRLCLCVAGPGLQGCDIAPITRRTREEWQALLGRGGNNLLDVLLNENGSLDRDGTRVWAAMEAFRKGTGEKGGLTKIVQNNNGKALFQGISSDGSILNILTLALDLTWGPERILALTVQQNHSPKKQPLLSPGTNRVNYEDFIDTEHYEVLPDGGPRGQLVFVQRRPVTFRPSAQLSRTVYFTNYINWMGEIREASAWPVLGKLARLMSSGSHGGVTNFCKMQVLGEATTGDRVEIRLWLSGNGGPADSTMDLTYDFRKMLVGGGYERLAWCELQTTWVRILGFGVVKPEPYPDYYSDFAKAMLPRYDAPNKPEPLPEPLLHLIKAEGDEVQYLAPSGPVIQPVLYKQIFETSLDDANVVGNIYFANYYTWMGKTRDRYFFDLIPEYFRGNSKREELICAESRVDYLREAMPFDRIEVTMALKVLNTFSATFYFEYFRLEPDGKRVKLAYGEHLGVWVIRDAQGNPTPSPFPAPVREAFIRAIASVR